LQMRSLQRRACLPRPRRCVRRRCVHVRQRAADKRTRRRRVRCARPARGEPPFSPPCAPATKCGGARARWWLKSSQLRSGGGVSTTAPRSLSSFAAAMALRAPAARCAAQLRASSSTTAAAATTPLAPPRAPRRRRHAAVAAPRAAFTPRGVAATDMPAAATGPTAAPSPLDALSSSLNALLSVAQSPVRAQYAAAQGVRAPACRHAHSVCAMCNSTSSRRAAPFLRRAALQRAAARREARAHKRSPQLTPRVTRVPSSSCASRTFWCRASSTRASCCAQTWTPSPSRAPSQRRARTRRRETTEHASVVSCASAHRLTLPPRHAHQVLTSAPGDEPLTGSDLLGRQLSPEESKKARAAVPSCCASECPLVSCVC
jgi:hypothetical protein